MRNAGTQRTDPELRSIAADLEGLGHVVVPHGGEELCVRLPLLCSVRVRREGEGLRFIPHFGPFRRSTGLIATSLMSLVAVVATVGADANAGITLSVAFAGIVALVHDGCRFVVTEGCIARVQQLLLARRSAGAGQAPLLQQPAFAPHATRQRESVT